MPPLLKQVSIEVNTSGKSLSELLEEARSTPSSAAIFRKRSAAIRVSRACFRTFRKSRRITTGAPASIRSCISSRSRALYERHPFIATSLFKAFNESKKIALQRMRYAGMLQTMMPWMLAQIEEMDKVFGPDPWPYGVEENRKTLETGMGYMVQQGLIAKPIPIDDLFVPVGAG